MLVIAKDNYTLMQILNFVGILVGAIGVMLMFRMRKLGFHLYIIYTILSVFYWFYFYVGNDLALFFIVWSLIIGGLFVGLYAMFSKKMIWFQL